MADFSGGLAINPGLRISERGLVEGLEMQIEGLASGNYNGDGYGYVLIGRGYNWGFLWDSANVISNAATLNIDSFWGGATVYYNSDTYWPSGIVFGGPSLGVALSFPAKDGFSEGREIINTGTQK